MLDTKEIVEEKLKLESIMYSQAPAQTNTRIYDAGHRRKTTFTQSVIQFCRTSLSPDFSSSEILAR